MSSSALSRREFIVVGAGVVCATVGCASEPTSPRELPEVEITSDAIVIPLAAVPELARADGSYVVRSAAVIVINLGADVFRAFSNVCTHAGCGVDRFARGRLICPCHGSEYDTSGRNVEGPAPDPLTELPVQFDAAARTVRIQRR